MLGWLSKGDVVYSLFTCILIYCLHVHSFIVYVYTPLLFTCTLLHCLHVHSFIVYMYTPLFTCTLIYCLHVDSFIVYMYIDNNLFNGQIPRYRVGHNGENVEGKIHFIRKTGHQ